MAVASMSGFSAMARSRSRVIGGGLSPSVSTCVPTIVHSTDSGIKREISSVSLRDGGPGHTNPTLCEKYIEPILLHRTMVSRGELVNTSQPFSVTMVVSLNAVPYCPIRRRAIG